MNAKNAKSISKGKDIKRVKNLKMVRTEESAKEVLDLSGKEAFEFFMRSSSYCNVQLPKYIDFGNLLSFIEKTVGKGSVNDICHGTNNKNKVSPSSIEKASYTFFMNKDEKYTYRPVTLVNPYLYYCLVRDLTQEENWNEIKKRFQELKNKKCSVCSIPTRAKETTKTNIQKWWKKVEQQSIEQSLKYKYMFVTDIANCYPSVYTHSIAWAMYGKEEAKEKRSDRKLIGNRIDSYIQGMQYGQTNGLPQGNEVSNLIAELILAYADQQLFEKLQEEKIENYWIIRYRDDYRIFSNSKEELEKIALTLQVVLSELNFQLNKAKTKISEDIIETSVKQDKLDYILSQRTFSKEKNTYAEEEQQDIKSAQIREELMFILLFSKKHPNSGTITRLLSELFERIKEIKSLSKEQVSVLAAIDVEIALCNPRVYDMAISILSVFVDKLKKKTDKMKLIRGIQSKFSKLPNVGFVELWLQRIVVGAKLTQKIKFENPLCKIVDKMEAEPWDNTWVEEKYRNELPLDSICNDKEKNKMPSIISPKEVCVFSYSI